MSSALPGRVKAELRRAESVELLYVESAKERYKRKVNEHLAKERKETDALRTEALRLGIPLPRTKGWWWFDDEAVSGISSDMLELIGTDDYEYLTELGKAGTRKLIREELNKLKDEARKDIQWERQNTQWKLTVAGVIIGWIFGIAGIVVAVISLLRK